MIPWDQLPELSPGLEEMAPRCAVLALDAKPTQIYEGINQLNRAAMVKEILRPGSSEFQKAGEPG